MLPPLGYSLSGDGGPVQGKPKAGMNHAGAALPRAVAVPYPSKSQNSLLNSLIAGKSRGDGRDHHCVASQPSRGGRGNPQRARKACCWRVLATRRRSLNSQIGELAGHFGKSLRPRPRIFPSWGVARQRQGSISTLARACGVTRPILSPACLI
jgi:hypothetical protein